MAQKVKPVDSGIPGIKIIKPLTVKADADWSYDNNDQWQPFIVASVQDDNGVPLTDLKMTDFKIGSFVKATITPSFKKHEIPYSIAGYPDYETFVQSGDGFYFFLVSYDHERQEWPSKERFNPLTLVVEKIEGNKIYRGQCLVQVAAKIA